LVLYKCLVDAVCPVAVEEERRKIGKLKRKQRKQLRRRRTPNHRWRKTLTVMRKQRIPRRRRRSATVDAAAGVGRNALAARAGL
jgi:MinD superfamily P-loop ATPase